MFPDYKLRIAELLELAEYFAYGDEYLETANRVISLAIGLIQSQPVTTLKESFNGLLSTFQREFVKEDTGRIILFSAVRFTIISAHATAEKRQKVLAVLPLFEEAIENSRNFMPIMEAFKRFVDEDDMRMHYYAMCLLYLFNSEGVFDAATRILYAMNLIGREQFVPQDLSEMKWYNLRDGLADMRLPAGIIFEGWADGRVRNAIAHSRFSYDDVTRKMRFRDLRTRYQPAYDHSFTIYEFSDMCTKLDNLFHVTLNYLILIRVLDLVSNPNAKDVGKLSIFKQWKGSPLLKRLKP